MRNSSGSLITVSTRSTAPSLLYIFIQFRGVISWPAAHTHAVHPLQLYFALAGVAFYLGGRYWQRRATFAGQVWLNVLLLYFGTTFFLELLGG
jgi:hypothetical protein